MTFAKRALHMRHLPSPTHQPREVVLLCPHFTGTQGTERWGWPQALEEMAEPTRRTTVPAHTKGRVLTCEEPVVWQTPGQGRVATWWSLPPTQLSHRGLGSLNTCSCDGLCPPELWSHAMAAAGFSPGVGCRPHPSESAVLAEVKCARE